MDTVYQWIAPAKLVQIKKEGNKMKKLLLIMCLTVVFSNPAISACNGGTEYTVNGDTFCISNIRINWWSAANWCKANGRHLATIYEVCPDWDGNTGDRKCPVIASSINYAWTATADGSKYAFVVTASNGDVSSYFNRYGAFYAICK